MQRATAVDKKRQFVSRDVHLKFTHVYIFFWKIICSALNRKKKRTSIFIQVSFCCFEKCRVKRVVKMDVGWFKKALRFGNQYIHESHIGLKWM